MGKYAVSSKLISQSDAIYLYGTTVQTGDELLARDGMSGGAAVKVYAQG